MKSGDKKRGRAQRQHAERVRREQRRAKSRRRIVGLIRILSDGEADPDAALVDAILMLRPPELRVLAHSSLLSIPDHEAILAETRRALDAAELQLQPHGVSISLRRFFSDYLPITRVAEMEIADNRRARRAQIILAKHVLPHVHENMERAAESLAAAVSSVVVPRNSMDGVFFLPVVLPRERPAPTIIIAAYKATPTYFVRDGKERPAWRCGGPTYVGSGIAWVAWTAEIRGAPPGSPPADVFVQSHALRNLRERLPVVGWSHGLLEFWAYRSLKNPKLVPTGPKEWLVEFHVDGIRLGYFTAVEIDGRILITTFLFLTMRNTPEGMRIREALGLRADQVEWLRMDTLPYFTQSDAAQDGELREVLTLCGCGHLFDLIGPDAREITLPGKARETRRHMRLPALRFMRAFSLLDSPVGETPDLGQEPKPGDHGQVNDNGTDTPIPADGLGLATHKVA
jgi:hypothetical protein